MKATLSKKSIEKLKNLSQVTQECIIERQVRLQHSTSSIILGMELKDLPDDFYLPINNLSQFIKMVSKGARDSSPATVEYEKMSRDIGLSTKTVYQTTISFGKEKFSFFTKETEDMLKNTEKDKNKKFRPQAENFSFKITKDELSSLAGGAGTVGADVLNFVAEYNVVSIRAGHGSVEEAASYNIEVPADEIKDFSEFALTISNLNKIDSSNDYSIVMCEKACMFNCEAENMFYIFAPRRV